MIIAANFKMNLTLAQVNEFANMLNANPMPNVEIFLFPNTASLAHLLVAKSFEWGAQNAYPAYNGAYTGEIGAEILESLHIKTVLIGHSERRMLHERHEFCVEKCNFYASRGFKIIYCIGEPIEIREKGQHAVYEFLESQLRDVPLNYPHLHIAYEPIWAIGTQAAQPEQITQTHKDIKTLCGSAKRNVLYGGSVKPDNVQDILKLPHVDGVLVGSASLVLDSFMKILKVATQF